MSMTEETRHKGKKKTTATKNKHKLHLSLPDHASSRPAISALYLVTFDARAGYQIGWKRSVGGLDIDDSVEFKSLPSGLHNVDEDLVYFVHESRYAGVSAFVNKTATEHERGALMLAVGALIKLDNGRLGRSWRHADRLKDLARHLAVASTDRDLLESYWEEYRADKGEEEDDTAGPGDGESEVANEAEQDRPERPSLEQAQAKSLMPGPTHELSMFHPARSIPTMLESFGPLIYPLYKAALLRKRILILLEAPVELACNFVYDISILSNIPSILAPLIPLEPLPVRLQPLFSIGIHDIDSLSSQARTSLSSIKDGEDSAPTALSKGWVACSTDDVLAHKKELYDVVVKMPSSNTNGQDKQWPSMKTVNGDNLCANDRDMRRFLNLRKHVSRRITARTPILPYSDDADSDSDTREEDPLLSASHYDGDDSFPDLPSDQLEPVPWSALVYSSFIWWASAGEKAAEREEESVHDSSLWTSFDAGGRSYTDALPSGRPASLRSSHTGLMTDGTPSAPEMAIIAYFHRLTTGIMEVLTNLVDDTEDDEVREARERRNKRNGPADEKEPPEIIVESEDMVRMGLDPWSQGDRVFVAQLLELYWDRKAKIKGGRIECCGIKIG